MRYLLAVCLAVALCLGGGVPMQAGHDEEEPVNLAAPEQVKRLIDVGENVVFVDLRAPEDYRKGRLPGAISLPIGELPQRWKEIPKTGRVVLYCACPPGLRDETYVYLILRKENYRNIAFLDAGYPEWVKRSYPIEIPAP